ncbi:unnamed protein product [Eruca vesicaria subsp. sativa]|uniref:Lectin n=1 Tax=Eruca vesicaria subsp. sativa TaxID=29727 RepID=A0ABC8JYK6_ERUVS|nr:unnamed protein product [Eruca vesicaria subsp. sativa]
MGIAAFEWGEGQLTLLMINRAAWNGEVLSGRAQPNGETWCGISRNGRVAFLVDTMIFDGLNNCVSFPAEFLQGHMSPEEFANEIAEDPVRYPGITFNLIVADITSNSMYHISKVSQTMPYVHTQQVAFGVHTLSHSGLDIHLANDLRLKDFFTEMIDEYENKQLPSLKEIAERFMYDPIEAVEGRKLTAFFVNFDVTELNNNCIPIQEGRYRTTSTTALTVKPTYEVEFYERYLDNGEWRDHEVTFNIV